MVEERTVTALTHTALRDRPRRLWSFNDVSLPGLRIPGLLAGAGVLVSFLMLGWALQSVLGGPTIVIAFLLGVIASVTAYFAWGMSVSDLGGAGVTILFWVDYQFRQPKSIHGSGANREPTHLQWQVILWEPTDSGWSARRDATYQWLIDHAPEGTAIAAVKNVSTDHHQHFAGGRAS